MAPNFSIFLFPLLYLTEVYMEPTGIFMQVALELQLCLGKFCCPLYSSSTTFRPSLTNTGKNHYWAGDKRSDITSSEHIKWGNVIFVIESHCIWVLACVCTFIITAKKGEEWLINEKHEPNKSWNFSSWVVHYTFSFTINTVVQFWGLGSVTPYCLLCRVYCSIVRSDNINLP